MLIAQLIELGEAPIMLADGKFALIIAWNQEEKTVGAQVPGEDETRWIEAKAIVGFGAGALMEVEMT